MTSFAVLTALGADRPGLIDEISSFLSEKNINIEDSRMAVLGGEFAIILLASGEGDLVNILRQDTDKLEALTKLDIFIKSTISPKERSIEPSLPHRISITSLDHPGLVHDVTKFLHQYNINIETMDTHVKNAPISGTPIFNMQCLINVPVKVRLSEIKDGLKELEHRLDVDIDFEPVDTM